MKLLQLLKLKPVLAGIGGLALVGIFIFPGVPQARISLAALQAQIDALQNLFDDHESEQALQKSPTVYRWAVWSSYNQACCWYGGNPQGNASLFGGVFPQVWGNSNGEADDMSSDKEVLRTLFNKKGYAGKNAMVAAQTWESFSGTNSRHAATLFRIYNSTETPIVWNVKSWHTAYDGFNERASIAVNGNLVWTSGGFNIGADFSVNNAISIPAGQTSTVIFVSASSAPSVNSRSVFLAFSDDSLELPDGLEYVDDLGTATGGWDQ